MDCGTLIMHRIHDTITDIQGSRVVTKMKATITQRFVLGGCKVNAESDYRFFFLFGERDGKWGVFREALVREG